MFDNFLWIVPSFISKVIDSIPNYINESMAIDIYNIYLDTNACSHMFSHMLIVFDVFVVVLAGTYMH